MRYEGWGKSVGGQQRVEDKNRVCEQSRQQEGLYKIWMEADCSRSSRQSEDVWQTSGSP